MKKRNGKTIKPYEFSSSERYFDLVIYDSLEEGMLYFDLGFRLLIEAAVLNNFLKILG